MHFLVTVTEHEFSRAALCKHKMNTQKSTIQGKTMDSSITSSCNANWIHYYVPRARLHFTTIH